MEPKRTGSSPLTVQAFFGNSPTPHELIEKLIVTPPDDPQKLLKLDDHWSLQWQTCISSGIYNREISRRRPKISADYPVNPLDALLAVAWGLQTGGVKGGPSRRSVPPPTEFPPWTAWWEKERLTLAVMQLAVRHQQTLFWWGTRKGARSQRQQHHSFSQHLPRSLGPVAPPLL